jgi:hypothetical protein
MFESHGKCTAHPGNIPCAAEAFLPPPPDHLLTVQKKKRPPPRLLLGGKAAILETQDTPVPAPGRRVKENRTPAMPSPTSSLHSFGTTIQRVIEIYNM